MPMMPTNSLSLHIGTASMVRAAGELRKLRGGVARRWIEIIRYFQYVGNLNRSLGCYRASDGCSGVRSDDRIAPPLFRIGQWCAVQRNGAKSISLGAIQHTELCLAEPRRIRQHRFEHRLKIARRSGNNLEHFR